MPSQTPPKTKKKKRGRPVTTGESPVIMARVPASLVEMVDQIGRERGARTRSDALRATLELLAELKAKKKR